jgi:nitrate/nitrite transport system ATP-binding protein
VTVIGQATRLKTNPTIGFIPLTDCAPIIIAKEKGFLCRGRIRGCCPATGTQLESDRPRSGHRSSRCGPDGGGNAPEHDHWAGNKPSVPVISALVLSRNGNAITLSNKYRELGVEKLEDLKEAVLQSPDKIATFGMVHPASMHNLLLRYWLASGGIDPDRDVNLAVIPPPQMVSLLKAGKIDGYCVGEPWNSYAVQEKLGYVIATDLDILPGHQEKVLGVREAWAAKHPETHIAMVKALIKACEYCDDRRNREEIVNILSQPQYVGVDSAIIRLGFLVWL